MSRSRNNKKFFYPYTPDEITDTKKRGRPKTYGDTHQLNDPATWHVPDESIEFSQMSASGKLYIIKIDCWDEVIMKGKKGSKLSDYPLRLLRVQVCKESGEVLFKRPLWLTAAGKRRLELSLSDIFNSYRQRFDIEHFFRFGKNRLLMDKIQTPDVSARRILVATCDDCLCSAIFIALFSKYVSKSMGKILACIQIKCNNKTTNTSPKRLRTNYSNDWHTRSTTQTKTKSTWTNVG